jgi:hypothetical protein
MSTTQQIPAAVPATSSTTSSSTDRRPVWKQGVAAAVAASVATTVLAVVAKGAGVSFEDSTGAAIPIAGFAELTLFFSLAGTGIAALLARKAHRPRSTFVRTAVVLTVLSYVPDLTVGFGAGSAASLITLHTVAAAIVVPTLARRLAPTR